MTLRSLVVMSKEPWDVELWERALERWRADWNYRGEPDLEDVTERYTFARSLANVTDPFQLAWMLVEARAERINLEESVAAFSQLVDESNEGLSLEEIERALAERATRFRHGGGEP
jgi:hypothetical protein